MRDKTNPKIVKILIEEIREILPELQKSIRTTSNQENKNDLKEMLLMQNLELTIALYSSGAAKEEIKNSLLETIISFEDVFKWFGFKNHYGGYDQMIWLVSLGVLCEIDLGDFKRITAIIKRDKVKDKLLDFIIHSKQTDWPIESYSYIQVSPYQFLNPDGVANPSSIKEYLTKFWYKGHKDSSWHDSHKNNQVNIYFGYWSWESAAIVKINGIEDGELKDQLYYPYDAVHW